MQNPTKLEIDKIYTKIDKIAKIGSDNYLEYYLYIDSLIRRGQYSLFIDCLDIYFNYDVAFKDLVTVKKESWKKVLFETLTTFQESKKKLMKSKQVYQNALFWYLDVPQSSAKVVDTSGKNAELQPVISGGGVSDIKILNSGSNYSASASVVITGGIGQATATPVIAAGKIVDITIVATGSNHNTLIKLGKITETDTYEKPIDNQVTQDDFQKFSKNKTTFLVATKNGATQSATFSSWNYRYSYDKNLINLYSGAIDYLLDI
jgi:hypothetical protein